MQQFSPVCYRFVCIELVCYKFGTVNISSKFSTWRLAFYLHITKSKELKIRTKKPRKQRTCRRKNSKSIHVTTKNYKTIKKYIFLVITNFLPLYHNHSQHTHLVLNILLSCYCPVYVRSRLWPRLKCGWVEQNRRRRSLALTHMKPYVRRPYVKWAVCYFVDGKWLLSRDFCDDRDC